jgi:hypothetical protein
LPEPEMAQDALDDILLVAARRTVGQLYESWRSSAAR